MLRNCSIITVSTSRKSLKVDKSGNIIQSFLKKNYPDLKINRFIVKDNEKIIFTLLKRRVILKDDLVLTTGGTGLSPDDVTPEATMRVIKKEVPAVILSLILPFIKKIPTSALSRAKAGIAGKTFIVNLPGSPLACRDQMKILLKYLNHAMGKIQGDKTPCRV
ncbi:MAG: MogA/MoaB family molybdenum cofactor biosynthesis protein [Candidatus Hydrogenedentota bacterium]